MAYKNPSPSVDDEYEGRYYSAGFTFEKDVTKEEAMRGINNVISENGGKLPDDFVHMIY